jgi:hypothetical protein
MIVIGSEERTEKDSAEIDEVTDTIYTVKKG